jgi:hypothetical protein
MSESAGWRDEGLVDQHEQGARLKEEFAVVESPFRNSVCFPNNYVYKLL